MTPVSIEYREGSKGAWAKLLDAQTDQRGYFSVSAAYKSSRQFRIAWTSGNGTVMYGGPTRAYSAP